MSDAVERVLVRIRACRICEAHLPLGPRPILQASSSARLQITSQAPGRRVHLSGVPFGDASGDRLRDWMGMDKATFYDAQRVAIVPMGFCFPGTGKSGDLPPRPECAPMWHPKLLPLLTNVRLTLLVGWYAQKHMLGPRARKTLTATCEAWRDYLPDGIVPLPHPSPRNLAWFKRHPWFEAEVIPELRRRVRALMDSPPKSPPPPTTRPRAARR